MHARALLAAARAVRAPARLHVGPRPALAGGGRAPGGAAPRVGGHRVAAPTAATSGRADSPSPATAQPPRGAVSAAAAAEQGAADRPPAVAAVAAAVDADAGGNAAPNLPAPPPALAALWAAYNSALARHPVLVKSATSFVGFLVGDLIAQAIVGNPYDAHRTLRLVLFGMLMDGPIGHLWYTTLDRNVYPDDPKSTKAVVTKTALDQLLWAPAFSCVFFFFIHALDGHPAAAVEAIRTKLGPMLLANYALWPAAHLVNFRFVPPSQRILYINAVQVLWSAYLSHLAARGMAPLR